MVAANGLHGRRGLENMKIPLKLLKMSLPFGANLQQTQTMKHTQALQDFHQTFTTYLELDSDDFYVECGCFHEFYDDHGEEFTELEDELYWGVDVLIDVAEDYFKPIADQERMDYERDLRNDLSSECNH